jgi:hypothetical protein
LEAYFTETPQDEWTVTGLALALQCDRDTLLNYEKNKNGQHSAVPEEVIRLIKKAKLIVHNAYEKDLRRKGRSGDIFALKNFGWTDKTETEHSGTMTFLDLAKQFAAERDGQSQRDIDSGAI